MNILGIEIEKLKFIAMDQFSLNWRFTDPKCNQLPTSDLEKIQPLADEISEQLSKVLSPIVSNSSLIECDDSYRTDLAIVNSKFSQRMAI